MAAAQVMSMNGHMSDMICRVCSDICQVCGEECNKHKDMEHCVECAEACFLCAEECRKMASIHIS
jgi:hypothetical protein